MAKIGLTAPLDLETCATCGGANRSLFARMKFEVSRPCDKKSRKDGAARLFEQMKSVCIMPNF